MIWRRFCGCFVWCCGSCSSPDSQILFSSRLPAETLQRSAQSHGWLVFKAVCARLHMEGSDPELNGHSKYVLLTLLTHLPAFVCSLFKLVLMIDPVKRFGQWLCNDAGQLCRIIHHIIDQIKVKNYQNHLYAKLFLISQFNFK